MDFSALDILNLNKLINGDKDEEDIANQVYSGKTESVLNPGNLFGTEKKELAKPYTKIEAKINGRMITKPENDIWKEEEFIEQNIIEDGRPKPKFEILFKQCVKTEDIYLGLSGKDVSSNSCDQLLVKVWLPDTQLKEIGLEIKEQSLHLQTPKYLLNHILPYKVQKDKNEAKWDKDKGLLLITLYIIKKQIWEEV